MWFSSHHSLIALKQKWHISAHSLLVRRNHMTSPQLQGSLGNAEDHMEYLMGSIISSRYTDGRKTSWQLKLWRWDMNLAGGSTENPEWRLWLETWRFLIFYSRHAWAIPPPPQSVEWMELDIQVGESTWFKWLAPCRAQPASLVTFPTFPRKFRSFYK